MIRYKLFSNCLCNLVLNFHNIFVSYLTKLSLQVKESGLKNNVPDFHWFQLQGIKALTAVNGENSEETIDGQKVLNEAISTLVQSYNEIYNNEVFI